jgi:alpha-amylase
MKISALAVSLLLAFGTASAAPATAPAPQGKPFTWENATVYFLLTDRFNNGNPANDLAYGRKADAAPARGFMGGDLAGITAKIKEGYFTDLGVDAIWITPPKAPASPTASTATGRATSPPSTPTWGRKRMCASWSRRPTRTASACCSTW